MGEAAGRVVAARRDVDVDDHLGREQGGEGAADVGLRLTDRVDQTETGQLSGCVAGVPGFVGSQQVEGGGRHAEAHREAGQDLQRPGWVETDGRHSPGTSTSSQWRLPGGGRVEAIEPIVGPDGHGTREVPEPVAGRVDQASYASLDLVDEPLQPLDLPCVPFERVCGVVVEAGRPAQGEGALPRALAQGVAGPAEPARGVGAGDQPVGLGADVGGLLAQVGGEPPDHRRVAVHCPPPESAAW